MNKLKKSKQGQISFNILLLLAGIMTIIMFVLTSVQKNVNYSLHERKLSLLGNDAVRGHIDQDPDVLLLYEEGDDQAENARNMAESIFSQMKIPYEVCASHEFNIEKMRQGENMAFAMTHLQNNDEMLNDIVRWVKQGGNFYMMYVPEMSGTFSLLYDILGIKECGGTYSYVEALRFPRPFMIGADNHVFRIESPYDSSMSFHLKDDCEVYMENDEKYPTPIVWRYKLKKGCTVVSNLGFIEKAYLGFYSSSYSLLGDNCCYPVVNGSTFFIDDFPSPVPGGNGDQIFRDYGMDIKTFYSQVWWNDIYNLAQKYGIRYTGLVIEDYSDKVKQPFPKQENDLQLFQYYGNMLLNAGGEIGFHGYNHMPIVFDNFNYYDKYDSYVNWNSYEDASLAIHELDRFCNSLFPDQKFQVYVPPSNILSKEGRELLARECPDLKSIASIYFSGEKDCAYEQEFGVGEHNIVNTPRVISGYVLNEYMRISAFSELNFHFVNSHFQHPDDVLDVDRGADMGWATLYATLSDYTAWLYESAPDLRDLTGSELAAAVQRWDYVDVKRTVTEDRIILDLDGFVDEAWFMVRVNEGTPGEITGGTMEELQDGLYLMKASADHVEIEIH